MVTGRNDQMGCISNIIAGIVGAFVGGWIMNQLVRGGVKGFDLPNLGVAFVNAVVVLPRIVSWLTCSSNP